MHSFGALGVALTAAAIALSFAPSADLGTDYIVVLGYEPAAGGRGVDTFVREAHAELAVRATHRFTSALSGFSARLTERQRFRIASDPRVLAIVPDERIQLVDESLSSLRPPPMPATSAVPSPTTSPAPTQRPPLPTPGPDSQIVPTGVAQIGRPSLATAPLDGSDRRVDIDLAVIDTGVSRHADLNVVGGRDCTGSGTWKDGHGHGTHVAGSAAALDNGFGVVGVAPGARIWSVKILDADGVGRASWLLCGIEWVIRQRDPDDSTKPLIEVANLSARFRAATSPTDDGNCGRTKRDVVHQAVCRLIAAGTTFVVAAGNDTQNAGRYRPGGYSEVITVSALSDFDGVAGGLGLHSDSCPPSYAREADDRLLRASNYGRVIDLMAPGKCIWSTNRNGRYRPMSGTSMASPHVAGAAALYREIYPQMSPAEIRNALRACGTHDWFLYSDRDDFHEPLLNVARLCIDLAPP